MATKRNRPVNPDHASMPRRCTRSTYAQDKQRSNFFKLPPELRNYVYELALVQIDTRIQVTPRLKIPGLLTTCRQTQQESIRIYWLQNKFEVKIFNLDITILTRLSKLLCGYTDAKYKVDLKITVVGNGNSRWDRAVVWCEYMRVMSKMRRLQEYGMGIQGQLSL